MFVETVPLGSIPDAYGCHFVNTDCNHRCNCLSFIVAGGLDATHHQKSITHSRYLHVRICQSQYNLETELLCRDNLCRLRKLHSLGLIVEANGTLIDPWIKADC